MYPFDFRTDARQPRKRTRFHQWLRELPHEEYFLRYQPPFVFIQPLQHKLTPCHRPDRTTFAEYKKQPRRYRHAMHFVSLSGRTCLVVPVKPYAHIGCFAREASESEFRDLMLLTSDIARASPDATIETHGMDVGWLHIRITCPQGGCPSLPKRK